MFNNADSLAYSAEKMLEDLKEKVPADKAQKIKSLASELRDLLNSPAKDAEKVKAKTSELTKVMQEFSSELYKGAGQQQGPSQEDMNQGQGSDDNVVDADFEASEDKK